MSFFSSPVYGCIALPRFETKTGCDLRLDFKDEQQTTRYLESEKEHCGLNIDNEDIEIIKNFVVNGYSVKEQTGEEYDSFLEEVRLVNKSRPENCLAYLAVYKKEKWTGYIGTGYTYTKDGRCLVTTCSQAVANVLLNDLTPAPISEAQESSSGLPTQVHELKKVTERSRYQVIAALSILLITLFAFINLKRRKK